MSGSVYGKIFTVATFGESHGAAAGAVVDGVTPGLELNAADIQRELDRRRPGQSGVSTPRSETDTVQILSGVFEGKTTGAPVMMLIMNRDQRSGDYAGIKNIFRPGHADYTFYKKYGIRDYRGGGRASGRETVARVAAGVIAGKILLKYGITITAYTAKVGGIVGESVDFGFIERNPVRAADSEAAPLMERLILDAAAAGDSIGGVIECRVNGMPSGIGEPVFNKLDAELAKAILSIGGVKGIEFGAGFAAAEMRGSRHNDPITPEGFASNNAGGILGGISNGGEIIFRAAVKPTSSISARQNTVDLNNEATVCEVHGRHDPCLCPRMVPVVEAMTAIALTDLLKQNAAIHA